MKQILLNKTHDITDFASKDANRYTLQSVHYNAAKQCVEACDGRVLMRVPVVQVDGEFPPVKTAGEKEPIDTIIPLAPLKKAFGNIPKDSTSPVLSHVKLDTNGQITLTTTDLDTEQAVTCKPVDATYPNCEQIIPDKPATFRITLSGYILKRIAEYAIKHANGNEAAITFDFIGADTPNRFTVKIDSISGPLEAIGVFMPIKLQ